MDLLSLLPQRLKYALDSQLRRRGYVRSAYRPDAIKGVWVDVGAHLGETTIAATANPQLLIFAFEPNWNLARQSMGKLANFVVLPMAVSDTDGSAKFFINAEDGSSSLCEIDEQNTWKGPGAPSDIRVTAEVLVPTIRLDTFMKVAGLRGIDYLKVDAEGADLKVIQSAGDRLKDICEIKAEVEVAANRAYKGSASREEMIAFMAEHGFTLIASEEQNDGRQQNLTFQRTESLK
jgi:FkbM family methyltransferase